MFARRPAPIQVTWLGFWGTTGLSAMDYILSDGATIPPGEEFFYSERVQRLPGSRFCYGPPDYAPHAGRQAQSLRRVRGDLRQLQQPETKSDPEVVRAVVRSPA